jgi:ABC-type antimicrobial peptide transport system permease subunit
VLTAFAALALVLVSVGVYGVMSHSVGQRTREIGIRVALGADRYRVLWLIVRQGLGMTLTGLVLGTAVALVLGRTIGGLLYGVTATEPATVLTVAGALGLLATLACGIPAGRALRVDPTIALRGE